MQKILKQVQNDREVILHPERLMKAKNTLASINVRLQNP